MLTPYDSLHEVFANFSDPAVSYKPIMSKVGHQNVNETLKTAFDDPVRTNANHSKNRTVFLPKLDRIFGLKHEKFQISLSY